LRTSADDERVLDLVAEHLGRLRRADLASACRPQPYAAGLDTDARRQARRDRPNSRKTALTAQSSARWANAIIAGNDDQYRLARDAQYRHLVSLRAAITTIEKRLAAPTGDVLTVAQRKARRGATSPKGYATQAERFAKQRRLQHLRAELARAEALRMENRVRVVEGGARLAKARHHLDTAGLTPARWRDRWEAARYRITANGSGDEPFGNLTITVAPHGQVSVRLPKPLEHLANAQRSRYVLSGTAVFSHRGEEWVARITGGKSVSYTITRKPGRAGRYLTASWGLSGPMVPSGGSPEDTLFAAGPVVGVDLNDGHLAVRRLDAHGNPVGAAERIDIDLAGTSARRDAQVRHAITRLIHYAQPARGCRHRGGGSRFRRCAGHWARNDGPRPTWETLPPHRGRDPDRGVPQSAVRAGGGGRNRVVGGQPCLQQCLGRCALALALRERHPTSGRGHGDRASRPGLFGPATERCDTPATRGSWCESYRPGRIRQPAGEQHR
jgi:hypothetical protein